jgi:hypothetical protein
MEWRTKGVQEYLERMAAADVTFEQALKEFKAKEDEHKANVKAAEQAWAQLQVPLRCMAAPELYGGMCCVVGW